MHAESHLAGRGRKLLFSTAERGRQGEESEQARPLPDRPCKHSVVAVIGAWTTAAVPRASARARAGDPGVRRVGYARVTELGWTGRTEWARPATPLQRTAGGDVLCVCLRSSGVQYWR